MPTRLLSSLAALVAGIAIGAISACSGAAAPCTTNTDCGGGEVCLQIGSCASECSTTAQCGGDQRCSASGGCVSASGCGADTDCSATQVCDPTGACVDNCRFKACVPGQVCSTTGHCETPAQPDAGADAGSSCGGQLFQATRVQANFLIVLDHSGSMMEVVGGQPKWTSAVSAIQQLTANHEDAIRFGLHLFSLASDQCNPGATNVQIGDQMASEIAAALPSKADGKGTPIGGALALAAQNAGLKDPNRSNNVLLITDGMENCNGDPVAEVKALFGQDVKTYVVGFGGDVDAQTLSDMAVEGGTALPGATKYYQADNPSDLNAALTQVAIGALGCDFKLTDVPPDPSKIFVYVDGALQSRDTSKQNGWDYNAATNRVTLYGAACSTVTTNPSAKISLVYGCPDGTLVEGGGGGGSVPDLDGGPPIN